MNTMSDVKFVVFDISAEYAINILDLLKSLPSRIILTDSLPDYGEKDSDIQKIAEDFLVRHVVPEALMNKKRKLFRSVEQIIKDDKDKNSFHTIRIGTNNATVFDIWRTNAIIGRSY